MRWPVEFVFWLASAVPRSWLFACGRATGVLLHRLVRFRRGAIERHLRLAFPELNMRERGKLLREVYAHFGLLLAELLRLPRQTSRQLLDNSVIEGREHLTAALARGRGVLVLAGHLGNWEVGLATAAAAGLPVAAVTKEIKSGIGQYIADRLRKPHGVVAINRRQAIRPILSFLRKGGCVGFVLDQNMTADEGVFVDFFGRPACTMPGLAVLARRYRVPVVPVAFFRDDRGRHHLRFASEVEWEDETRLGKADDDAAEKGATEAAVWRNTQRYTAILEVAIREHPAQWLWMHRRWKTRPPEETGEAAVQ